LGKNISSTAYTSNRVRPTFSFGYSDVFGKDKNIGIALNLSHTINWVPAGGIMIANWEQKDTSPSYMRSFNHFDYHSTQRTRTGANIRVDYKVSQRSQLFLNTFYTYYDSEQQHEGGSNSVTGLAQVVTLDTNGQPIPAQTQFPFGNPSYRAGGFNAAGTRVQASILPGYTDQLTDMVNATYQFGAGPATAATKRYSFQPGGRHRFGNLELDYSGIYQESPARSGEKNGNRELIRGYNVQVLNTAWRLDGRPRDSVIYRKVTQTGGPDVLDPANWVLGGLTSTVLEMGSNIYGGGLNAKLNFTSPIPSYIKAGVKYMSEERYQTNPNKTFNYTGPQGAFLTNFIQEGLETGSTGDKWHPYGVVPQYLDLDKINDYRKANPQYFTDVAATSLQNEFVNDKTAREQVYAAYVMGNMVLGQLSVLGGLRVEKTNVSGESAVQDPRAGLTLTDPVERTRAQWGGRKAVERDYTNVLPGIHFKYEVTDAWLVRASYSASFGRPPFGSIYPDRRINYDTERITQNNPGIKPQESDNFDVSVERYFEPVGVISAGVFLKEIKNFLFSTVVVIPPGNDNGFDGDYEGWDLATQANGGFARVRGFELNYSQQLSFLPGFWRGFGVFANYTWLETEGNYGRVTEAASSALVNFTPRVASAGLTYSNGRFYARLNGNYTSSYLRAYNANPVLRSYRVPRTMVDAKLGFNYSPGLTLFVDASNIFNSKQKWYFSENPTFIADHRDHGVRYQAGISGRF
jgi:iron complex outermembrane recepter protein